VVRQAKKIVDQNLRLLSPLITERYSPDRHRAFRYPHLPGRISDLAEEGRLEAARQLAKHSYFIDDFLAQEIDKGNIRSEQFTREKRTIQLHGHCQQKALTSVAGSVKILSLPENYSVGTIPSGCCGMAGLIRV